MSISQANEFEKIIRQQIYKILQEEKLLQGEWHLGKVEGVISRYSLRAFIDGSQVSYPIPCNPNIIFTTGDEIWVHFVNGDSKNKFASYKRATGTESIVDVGNGNGEAIGDMTKSIYDTSNNGIVDRAENVDWNGIENKPATFAPLLGESSTTAYRGDRGKIAYDHSQTSHAPANAQKNSDITKIEIEAKLTGIVTSHTHSYEPANSNIQTHITNTANPHNVTKSQVGLDSVENKSSATIRSETTAINVTNALGFTPANNNDLATHTNDTSSHVTTTEKTKWDNKLNGFIDLPSTAMSLDSDQLLLYIPLNNTYKKITKFDLLSDIGGGSEQYVLNIKREKFTLATGQTVLNLTQGVYVPNTNRINVYINGLKQPEDAYQETSASSITLSGLLDEGTEIELEWFQLSNVVDYLHAQNHAIGGIDPISPADIGAETPNGAQVKATQALNDSKTYTDTKVAAIIDSSPETLNTLNELSQALGNDANFATSVTNQIAAKANQSDFTNHVDDTVKHITPIERTTWNAKANSTHEHSISDVTNLQTVLNGKALTLHEHEMNQITGLDTALNSKVESSTYNAHAGNLNIHVTQTEKNEWNGKQNALGFTPENSANKGSINGYAGLDVNAKVPYTQLPSDIVTQSDLGSAGYGDMTKGVYDTNSNGIVDRAEVANSVAWNGITGTPADLETTTGSQSKANTAESNAKSYTDTHANDTVKHITSIERNAWNAKSNFSGNYTDLTNKPTIPTSTSQITNDSNYKSTVIHRGAIPPVDTGIFWQPT